MASPQHAASFESFETPPRSPYAGGPMDGASVAAAVGATTGEDRM